MLALQLQFIFFGVLQTILDPLHFHLNFSTSLPTCTKKPAGILIGIVLKPSIILRRIDILTILNLLIHEHSMSLSIDDLFLFTVE